VRWHLSRVFIGSPSFVQPRKCLYSLRLSHLSQRKGLRANSCLSAPFVIFLFCILLLVSR
jgi:hypothetical protein